MLDYMLQYMKTRLKHKFKCHFTKNIIKKILFANIAVVLIAFVLGIKIPEERVVSMLAFGMRDACPEASETSRLMVESLNACAEATKNRQVSVGIKKIEIIGNSNKILFPPFVILIKHVSVIVSTNLSCFCSNFSIYSVYSTHFLHTCPIGAFSCVQMFFICLS